MTVLARDAVASDHLVYAWPFPIGPDCEVACNEDEQVVMCPGWMVGDRLGPGRHRWRTPDPMRPVGAFFVLTAPVEVSFDMVTQFVIPATGQPVRLRAQGSLQVRCSDPGLLIAQFVGLPFERLNDGVMRSVSRSVERMLARLLTRRVVMAGTPFAVTDPGMLSSVMEELIAYNPTAGAVFGVELMRMGHMVVAADDGQGAYVALPTHNDYNQMGYAQAQPLQTNGHSHYDTHGAHAGYEAPPQGYGAAPQGYGAPAQDYAPQAESYGAASSPNQYPRAPTPPIETIRGMAAVAPDEGPFATHHAPQPAYTASGSDPRLPAVVSGESGGGRPSSASGPTASGEIGGKRPSQPSLSSASSGAVSGEIGGGQMSSASGPTASGEIGSKRPSQPLMTSASGPTASGEIGGGRPSQPALSSASGPTASGEIGSGRSALPPPPSPSAPLPATASGEIGARPTSPRSAAPQAPAAGPPASASGEIGAKPAPLPIANRTTLPGTGDRSKALKPTMPPPLPSIVGRAAPSLPRPPRPTPAAAGAAAPAAPPVSPAPAPAAAPAPAPEGEARGAILGIGMGSIGSTPVGEVAGEVPPKILPGQRVLVPGPAGLMQSATVRQLLQGYYELEVGSSGQTIWVPVGGVIPEGTT